MRTVPHNIKETSFVEILLVSLTMGVADIGG